MRYVRHLLASLVLIAAMAILLWWGMARWTSKPPGLTTSSTGLTIEQIQLLSALTTLKIDVADAVVTDLHGYMGNTRAVLVVRGDVTLGVDLSAARFEKVDCEVRTAVLILPQPAVLSVRVDHEHTRLIDVRTGGVWMIVPGGGDAEMTVVNRAYRDAQRIVGGVADDDGAGVATGGTSPTSFSRRAGLAGGDVVEVIEQASRHAQSVLRDFFAPGGWRVEIKSIGLP